MAKKRLNKKVVLIGSVVFAFLVLAAIGVILHLSRDPEKFIKDGDAAVKAANEAIDDEIKTEEYKKAERSYLRARARAKSDSLRIEILFKLVDIFLETDQWNKVLGCWNEIIRIDPKNMKARYGRLKYIYIVSDSGASGAWKEVASQASEFIEVVEDADLLREDIAKWESFDVQESRVSGERMGPYLYLLRGRATLEMTKRGEITDPDDSLARAVDDLEKVRELEPGNVDAYWHLAQAAITKGEILASRGNLEERDKAGEQAKELLEQAVEVAGAEVRAHINLLRMKPTLARLSGTPMTVEQLQSLEPEYLSLVEKFPSSAEAFSTLAVFYQFSLEDLDKAIGAAEKAVELDEENVAYAMNAANLHYRKFSVYGQKAELYKAIEIAKSALALPGVQDKPGPRSWANRNYRALLYTFLADCYIEQVLEPCEVRTESESHEWLTDAEQAVHEIEQILGSGEDPQVIKWQGMLELAKGNKSIAIRKLYAAYEQFKASKPPEQRDARLSYALAKVFKNTSEVGAVAEFLAGALRSGIEWTKPEAQLDYVEVLLRLRLFNAALGILDSFEERYWANERSQVLRIRAYIGTNQFDEAEEELAKRIPDDPNTVKLNLALVRARLRQGRRRVAVRRLREKSSEIISQWSSDVEEEEVELQADDEPMTVELKSYRDTLTGLVEKLLSIEPNSVNEAFVVAACNSYIAGGKTSEANDLVDRFLGHFPDSATALFYKKLISEPEPGEMSPQRRKEIRRQTLLSIADPVRRSLSLGAFYRRNNEPNEAAEEFKKVLKIETPQEGVAEEPVFDQTEEMVGLQRLAANHLADIALGTKDWELAEQIANVARQVNLDDCEGKFFAALVGLIKEEYKDALTNFNECLRQRPVFSQAYMLRSKANAALGNEHASIEDVQKAASLNPLNGAIAKVLANALYQRNRRLGDNISSAQIIEARDALLRAMRLNPRDSRLLSFYAEYISEENPEEALAIRERLQRIVPSAENALLLGNMAMRLALRVTDEEQKEAVLDIATSSFEQARTIDPQNKAVLEAQAEYYRLTGQKKKAEELLVQSQNKKLLWSHYFRSGQFGDARRILEQLYRSESKDSSVVRGLLLVAEKAGDNEAVKNYSEELLSLEDSIENHLFQIRTFLKIGLVKEAEYKLQSFREKYPEELRALLFEAWLTMRQGRLEKALELTNRNLEVDQDNAVAWRLRGKINRLMANYEQAIIDLKRSKSLSDEPATQLALAKVYLQAGRVEDAITELENMIDNPQAPMESGILLEQIYTRLGKTEALMRFYSEVLRKFPDNLLWYNRAGAFTLRVRNFESAERLYELAWRKGVKGGRGDPAALDGYLQALLLGGKLNRLFEEAGKYVDSYFAPIAYLRMAEGKIKLGDKADAVQYCRKAVDKAGTDDVFAFSVLRRMYSLLGAKEVMRYCEGRLEAEPDSHVANYAMFNLAKINGEYNKALGYIDKCLQIIGLDSPIKVNYIMKRAEILQLAYVKTSDNDYLEGAITEYESLLAKMPNNTAVLNNLAYMLAERNVRLTDALEYAKRAHEARPNNPDLMDTYAYVLYKNGQFSKATELLQSALQQYEQRRNFVPAEVYEHLGMIKEELGSVAEAVAAYKQALEIGEGTFSKAAKERIKAVIERLSQ